MMIYFLGPIFTTWWNLLHFSLISENKYNFRDLVKIQVF